MASFNRIPGFIALALAILPAGCGGSNNSSMISQAPQQVTVSFSNGTPAAIATQMGSGAFTSMTPASQITLSLPEGITSYAIAYACAPATPGSTPVEIHVIEATTQETSSIKAACVGAPAFPSFGVATGSLSSTITGAATFQIFGKLAALTATPLTPGPFSVDLPMGTQDVAVVALDTSSNKVGIKIVRNQTIPGALNGGSGIAVTDAMIPQAVTVTNVPAGFNGPGVLVLYSTANGVNLSLASSNVTNPRLYAAIPAADTQPGDMYFYEASASAGTLPSLQGVFTIATSSAGGGPATLSLPAPWTFSGPSPARLPTFTFNYSGFSGQAFVADSAALRWSTGSTSASIDVTATARFLNGSNTITFPDLSALPGFFGPAPSGTTISWSAIISSSTAAPFNGTVPDSLLAEVINGGQFTQP